MSNDVHGSGEADRCDSIGDNAFASTPSRLARESSAGTSHVRTLGSRLADGLRSRIGSCSIPGPARRQPWRACGSTPQAREGECGRVSRPRAGPLHAGYAGASRRCRATPRVVSKSHRRRVLRRSATQRSGPWCLPRGLAVPRHSRAIAQRQADDGAESVGKAERMIGLAGLCQVAKTRIAQTGVGPKLTQDRLK